MIRKSTNDLTIRPKLSKAVMLGSMGGGLLLLLLGLYLSHSIGVQSGHTQFQQDQALIQQLNNTISGLRTELDSSGEGLVFAQRQQQIQDEAYKQISKAYANSEQKNRVLGSQLDFYRSIISPENGQSGPAIQSLEAKHENGQVTFDVILVQAIKHKTQVRGNLQVTLFESDRSMGQWPVSSPRSVSYQYFEQVSGSIERVSLADNAKLKVELSLQDGETLERWFDVSSASVPLLLDNENNSSSGS
jgi:hypothetical protein